MFLEIIYLGSVTNFAIAIFLNIRQIFAVKQSKVPKYLKEKLTDEDYQKTRNYNVEKLLFSTFATILNFIKSILIIYHNILPLAYESLDAKLNFNSQIVTQIVFLLIWHVCDTIMDLPLSVYSTFVIEEKYGFNETTPFVFITDLIKTTLLYFLFVPPLFGIVHSIIERFDTFYLRVSLFLMVFQLIMVVIFPTFIMPLFNKFEEMKESSLKQRVEELAKKVKFRLKNIFVMDGSKRSGHSNAFFIGLFKEKRIVFYDTLLEQTTDDQVIAILGHELGHWYYSHMWRAILMQFAIQSFSIYLFEVAIKNVNFSISIFGTKDAPLLLKMIYFNMVSQMISPLMTLLFNMLSRYNERQADRFAVENGYDDDLINALISLFKENRASLSSDWMYSTYNHSHPTLDERIALISDHKEKVKKKEE